MVEKLKFLPDKHHYAIAAVAVRSAQLDHMIEHVIAAALRSQPHTARFVLKNLNSDRVVGLLGAVISDAIPAERSKAEEMVGQINRLRTERNEIMHWIWEESFDHPEAAINSTFRPFREEQSKTKTADEIQAIADAMNDLATTLMEWVDQIDPPHNRPLPDISEPPAPRPNSA